MYYYAVLSGFAFSFSDPGVALFYLSEEQTPGSFGGSLLHGSFRALSPLTVRGSVADRLEWTRAPEPLRLSSTCTKIQQIEKNIDPLSAFVWGVLFVFGFDAVLCGFVCSAIRCAFFWAVSAFARLFSFVHIAQFYNLISWAFCGRIYT